MSAVSEFLAQWWVWAALAVGAVVAAVTFLLGLLVIRRRRRLGLLAAAVRALNAQPDAEEERGRRQLNRRRHKLVQVLVTPPGAAGKPFRGYVMDRSAHGLGLALPDCVAEGDVLRVRAANAPADSPWVPVRVIHRTPLETQYTHAGCRFVEPPPWNVLLLFG
jgi:hypothetical protein